MNFRNYLKDKLYAFIIFLVCLCIITFIYMAFKIDKGVMISSIVLFTICNLAILLVDFFRKKKFYSMLLFHTEALDKSYLVLETIEKPEFYEGELLYQALYEINKSMVENINQINGSRKAFKEYVEMWIHEVKIPLASLVLMISNQKSDSLKSIKTQIKRVEDCVDQVLYYVRSENAEKDYLIKEVNLATVVKNIGLKNMDDLLGYGIEFRVQNVEVTVLSDSKWLEFIIGQLVNNAIKYRRDIDHSYIKLSVQQKKDTTILSIEDNGIGIKKSDIKQVFDKSFTGENGRMKSRSTGMGLFIAKNMCDKLGHKISIESEVNTYTKVFITFANNEFYETVR